MLFEKTKQEGPYLNPGNKRYANSAAIDDLLYYPFFFYFDIFYCRAHDLIMHDSQ